MEHLEGLGRFLLHLVWKQSQQADLPNTNCSKGRHWRKKRKKRRKGETLRNAFFTNKNVEEKGNRKMRRCQKQACRKKTRCRKKKKRKTRREKNAGLATLYPLAYACFMLKSCIPCAWSRESEAECVSMSMLVGHEGHMQYEERLP